MTEVEALEEQKENLEVSFEQDDLKKVEEVKSDTTEELKENNKTEDIKDKNENKVKIIDISKKKEENKKQDLYYKLEGFTSNLGFSDSEQLVEKVFDSLIFLGGGFLASTTLATKTISSLAEKILK
ncbi:MAG: hypothetical protein KatS3mg068_1202 [Candidatus Sericytochromatia bacterium]|nr:MAG: hypothetical protein KatS3mg068_1202 [Candidatus Sericytochromatia bacterium]